MNFLIVKTSSLGDVIQALPVVEYLKSQFPHCQIDWVVEEEYNLLVKSHPDITQVHTLATRRWRHSFYKKSSWVELYKAFASLKKTHYEVVFDLQGNTKSACVTGAVQATRKVGFGWACCPEWSNYFVTQERFDVSPGLAIQKRYLSVVQQFFKDTTPFEPQGVELRLSPQEQELLKSYPRAAPSQVMVAFASKWQNKCLSTFALTEFLRHVHRQKRCFFYFVSGSQSEKQIADALAAAFPQSIVLQELSLPLWQRLMGEMDLVVAVDSAALALCGTTSTPSFSFFGPTQATVYQPIGSRHRHFQGKCPYHIQFTARCPQLRTCKTGACLKEVDVGDVLKSFDTR